MYGSNVYRVTPTIHIFHLQMRKNRFSNIENCVSAILPNIELPSPPLMTIAAIFDIWIARVFH